MSLAVREYGRIGLEGAPDGLDYITVTPKAYEHLRSAALAETEGELPLVRLSRYKSHEAIQVLNYVGVLGLPDGSQIEILPKTTSAPQNADESRQILWRMLQVVRDLPHQERGPAELSTLPNSWMESLTRLVLLKVGSLIRSGLKRDYLRLDEQSSFLRGQLQVARQMRARPGTECSFHVRKDNYVIDRPENRLIKSALVRLNQWAQHLDNKRLCSEHLFVFDDVSPSTNVPNDLRQWRNDRGMASYQPIRPWVELILSNQAPVFSQGQTKGVSLLFPMEKLFEDYVFRLLRRDLLPGFSLRTQAKYQYLVAHKGRSLFQMRPDGLVSHRGVPHAVLDTKWKLIDERLAESKDKYNLSQADFYQMYAYGMKYLSGRGNMYLIYPAHTGFTFPLPRFDYDDSLNLHILPFDLRRGRLILNDEEIDQAVWLS